MAKAKKKKLKKPAVKKHTKKTVRKMKAKIKSKTKAKTKAKKKKVSAIPKGYSNLTPYLMVNNATTTIEFYKKCFNAKEKLRMNRPDGKIAHCELVIGDSKFMLSDECPEMNPRGLKAGSSSISMHLYVKNVDETMAKALSSGAKLIQAADTKFYGDRIGTIEDPAGYTWHISTHVEDVSPAETRKRAAKLYANPNPTATEQETETV